MLLAPCDQVAIGYPAHSTRHSVDPIRRAANALTWTCCLLAPHPQVGRKLLDGLQSQLHGRAPAMADFDGLPYVLASGNPPHADPLRGTIYLPLRANQDAPLRDDWF